MSKGLTRKTFGSVFWTSTGTFVQFICNVLVISILARLLTPADFGLIAAATVVVSFGEALTRLGVTQAIVQRPVIQKSHIESSFWYSTGLGVFLTLIIVVSAPLLSKAFRIEELVEVLRVLSIVLLLRSMSAVAESVIQRGLKFKYIASVQIWSYVLAYTPVGISLAIAGWGVWSLVGATVARALVEVFLFIFYSRHSMRPRVDLVALTEVLRSGRGIVVNKIANQVATHVDNLVVASMMGATSLGLYSRAFRLMSLPANLFGQAVESVAFPTFAKVQDNRERLSRGFMRSVSLTACVALPLSGICVVLGPEIIRIFLGAQWGGAVIPFQILSLGIYFRMAYKTFGSLARATGHVSKLAFLKVLYASVILLLVVLGIQFGIEGVAAAVVLALLFHFVTLLRLGLYILDMKWKALFPLYVPALVLTACSVSACWSLSTALRTSEVASIVTLASSTLLAIVVAGAAILVIPRSFLGSDLSWWIDQARVLRRRAAQ